jgi:hypothetical protein
MPQSDSARATEILFDVVKLLEELGDIAERNEESSLNTEVPSKFAVKTNTTLRILVENALDDCRSAKFSCAYLK